MVERSADYRGMGLILGGDSVFLCFCNAGKTLYNTLHTFCRDCPRFCDVIIFILRDGEKKHIAKPIFFIYFLFPFLAFHKHKNTAQNPQRLRAGVGEISPFQYSPVSG